MGDTDTAVQPTGVVRNVPVLDLTGDVSADDLGRISHIRNVSAVVVRRDLAHLLTGIRMENVGAVVPVPVGAHVRVHTGSLLVGGDALADPGDNEVLLVTGSLVVTSPVTRVGYREIVVTGLALAPYGSESAFGAGLTRVTGSVAYYRWAEGQQFREIAGQVQLSGDTLANRGGNPDDLLIVAGQVIVSTPVTEVGFQRIFYGGQIVAPRESEPVLGPVLEGGGQVAWYAGRPRFFIGNETFAREFFELLAEPLGLALVGSFRIEDGIPADLLRSKVSEITLVGSLRAPKELIPVLQLLTTEKYGSITAVEGDPA